MSISLGPQQSTHVLMTHSMTTKVDVRTGRAKLAAYLEFRDSEGYAVGMASIVEFRLSDGRWRMYGSSSFQGQEPVGLDMM